MNYAQVLRAADDFASKLYPREKDTAETEIARMIIRDNIRSAFFAGYNFDENLNEQLKYTEDEK